MPQSLLVSYDLRGDDETSADYAGLIATIKGYGNSEQVMLSTWIVVTDRSAEDVRDQLLRQIDEDDRLFVGPLSKPAAWHNLMVTTDWMKARP
ncbi:MAG: hypothetical protein ACJ76Z_02895 [Thermoleophilaceae bacterium]